MTIHVSLNVRVQPGAPPPPEPIPQPHGELWTLNSYAEAVEATNTRSNFCAVTAFDDRLLKTGGQANWLELGQEEIRRFILEQNRCQIGDNRWHFFVAPSGRIYVTIDGADPDIPGLPLHWPRIAIASKDDAYDDPATKKGWHRNIVSVLEKTGIAWRIEGIPRGADYALYTPEATPWCIHRVWCIYGSETTSKVYDTPDGIQYMTILDPASGFKVPVGGVNQLWIPPRWFHARVTLAP